MASPSSPPLAGVTGLGQPIRAGRRIGTPLGRPAPHLAVSSRCTPVRDPGKHWLARRFLNVVVALIGIVLALPLWMVIAVLIKLTSRGPVFHVQTRVGVNANGRPAPLATIRGGGKIWGERPFRIYKFRTMYDDAEATLALSGPGATIPG